MKTLTELPCVCGHKRSRHGRSICTGKIVVAGVWTGDECGCKRYRAKRRPRRRSA